MKLSEFKNDAPPFQEWRVVFYDNNGCETTRDKHNAKARVYQCFVYLKLDIQIILN